MELIVMERFLDVAEAFLELALALVDLAADLGRPVAAELAGLFLDLALRLIPLAFDLVVHSITSLVPTVRGPAKYGQMRCHGRLGEVGAVSVSSQRRVGRDLTRACPPLSSRG